MNLWRLFSTVAIALLLASGASVWAKDDAYTLLDLSKDASPEEIKSAYRKMAMKFHPDRNPGSKSAESMFKAVNEANEILKNPDKRAAYDRFGWAAFEPGYRSSTTTSQPGPAPEAPVRPESEGVKNPFAGTDPGDPLSDMFRNPGASKKATQEPVVSWTDRFLRPFKSGGYKKVYAYAIQSADSGGLGLSPGRAKEFAEKLTQFYDKKPEVLNEYLASYGMVYRFALLPSTKYGLNMPPSEAAAFSEYLNSKGYDLSKITEKVGFMGWVMEYGKDKFQPGDGRNSLADFARGVAYRDEDPAATAKFLTQHQASYKKAVQPVSEGGLGLTKRDAWLYAQKMSNQPSSQTAGRASAASGWAEDAAESWKGCKEKFGAFFGRRR